MIGKQRGGVFLSLARKGGESSPRCCGNGCVRRPRTLSSGKHTLSGHSYSVYGVALTPDARRAVSASNDQTLKV